MVTELAPNLVRVPARPSMGFWSVAASNDSGYQLLYVTPMELATSFIEYCVKRCCRMKPRHTQLSSHPVRVMFSRSDPANERIRSFLRVLQMSQEENEHVRCVANDWQ